MYDFSKKCFSSYILLTDQISLSECLCFLKYWLIYILQLFVTPGLSRLWRHKFVNLRYLSNQAVFLHDQKVKTKTKIRISWERKELLRRKKKYFSSLFNSFLLPKVISDLRVRMTRISAATITVTRCFCLHEIWIYFGWDFAKIKYILCANLWFLLPTHFFATDSSIWGDFASSSR